MEYSQQRCPDQYQIGQPWRDQHHVRFPSDHSEETIVSFANYSTAYQYPAMPSEYHSQENDHKGVGTMEETVMVGEVPPLPQVPPPHPPRTQSNGWSVTGSMITSAATEKSQGEINSGRLSKLSSIKNIKWTKTGTWTFETIALLFAIAAVASIIAVLAYFDNKPLPSWPYAITLNAVIAILTTVANAAMAVPLSSGLGQLKWESFKTGFAPLTDMEVLDDASRGSLGAFNMLRKRRGGVIGSFGAVAIIVALFVSPFAQQIATYRTLSKGSDVGATNLRAMNFTMALPGLDSSTPFVPVLPIKAAVYNGLFMENNRPWTNLPVNCETGNCTWEPFDTLAVCNKCVDMTPYMVKSCEETSTDDDCGWETMDGKAFLSAGEVFGMTSQFESQEGGDPWSTIMKLTFMGTESSTSAAGNVQPWARQCAMSACVQTITSQIVNGNLVENVTNVVTNDTVIKPSSQGTDLEPVIIATDASTGSNNTSPTSYVLSAEAMLGMQSWFSQLFANGSASRSDSAFNKTIGVNLTVGISSGSTFFDTDIVQGFYWNYYEYPSGLDMLMDDLSVSLTVAFRSLSGQEPVNGTALRAESYVHVRWGFVTPLILAVVLTAGFLSTAMYRSWRCGAQLWKSSTLAVLFHGLEEDVREKFEEVKDFRMQRKTAQGVKVRLYEGGNGVGLLRAERVY